MSKLLDERMDYGSRSKRPLEGLAEQVARRLDREHDELLGRPSRPKLEYGARFLARYQDPRFRHGEALTDEEKALRDEMILQEGKPEPAAPTPGVPYGSRFDERYESHESRDARIRKARGLPPKDNGSKLGADWDEPEESENATATETEVQASE